jgi:hypothetical protein
MIKQFKQCIKYSVFAMMLIASAANADSEIAQQVQELVNTQIKPWLNAPQIIDSVKAQNARHAALTQADIDKLDKQWRAETKEAKRPLIDKVMKSDLSKHLQKLRDQGQGLYTEIFVMDNKGLNVGASDVTSDYWQGDEAKWKKTYLAGPQAVFVDEIEFDESTQTYQTQVSVSIMDPADQSAIGAITVGVNVEELTQ